jgi:hypothetical protein
MPTSVVLQFSVVNGLVDDAPLFGLLGVICFGEEEDLAGFNMVDDGIAGQQAFAGEATRMAYMTEEAQEGRDAFLEHRSPDWSDYPYYLSIRIACGDLPAIVSPHSMAVFSNSAWSTAWLMSTPGLSRLMPTSVHLMPGTVRPYWHARSVTSEPARSSSSPKHIGWPRPYRLPP